MTLKPKLFVGSSVEGLKVAYGVQANLQRYAEVTVWDQNVFKLSRNTMESLIAILDKSDFAIFVLSPDDVALIREKQRTTARDNVIFELGLFIGRLNRERTFFLVPHDQQDFHLPTDLVGMTPGTFENDREIENWQAATAVACESIRTVLKNWAPSDKRTQAEIVDDVITQLRTLLSRQLVTEYVGRFPGYMEKHICQCIEDAKEEIYIACDVLTYGAFSEPEIFKKYINSLETKRGQNIKIRFLILDSRIRELQDRVQLANCLTNEGFEARRNKETDFDEHVALLSTKTRLPITNSDEFFNALTKFEVNEIEKQRDLIEFAQSSHFFPIYMWISDKRRAVFTIPKYTEDAVEHGFTTTDENLVTCLRLIWTRYSDASKPA